jgi:Kef-type K+ transport system membrane component KefB
MTTGDLIIFFLEIAIMLGVALACGQLFRRFHLPTVLGELLGGVLLGPTLFGTLAPGAYAYIFPATATILNGREALLTISVVLFLLVVGMELNPGRMAARGSNIIWTSMFGILIPFAIGAGLVIFAPGIWGAQAKDNTVPFALFIGTALSISALPVISRILMDLNLLKTRLGTVIIASAAINDLIGWFLLAIIMDSLLPGESTNVWIMLLRIAAIFAVILTLGRWLVQRALRWYEKRFPDSDVLLGVFVLLAFLAAAAAEAAGTHAIFGAFLAGIAIAQNKTTKSKTHETLYRLVNYFFAPLYFVSIGLKANFSANFDLVLVLVLILVASLGKILGATLGARLSKMPLREAFAVGFGMNARGAMEVLIASIALQYGVIDQRVFVALVIMAFVTTIIASPIMQYLIKPLPRQSL